MSAVASVDEFVAALEPEQRAQVLELRRVILALPVELGEHIKWNSPSYVHGGVDRLTMNVRNREGALQLILHFGAGRPEVKGAPPVLTDATGLVRWLSDIRGVVTVPPGSAVRELEPALTSVLTSWLQIG
ncbi:DUF1801 domain-containing protein [Herbiconiux sp. CPCC 205716]|uniref:DUF1801 domain-containing protein n=1 Tax=Herbiconiux gentiana TaxID=2970912 RepID=A0ABT2GJ90_9MICO|nr:DUF1801 domain-containing protein [Herbiconiux gentiana]MCS5716289.1 DUF1801 domain-containing protein [Herbiconiux gentiana]